MADNSRISLIADFGRDRRLRISTTSVLAIKIYSINTAIGILLYAMLYCSANRSTSTLHCQLPTEPLPPALGPLYRGRRGGGFLSYTKDLYRPPAQYPYPYVRKGGSTVLTVRVRYIIKAPLVLMGLSN